MTNGNKPLSGPAHVGLKLQVYDQMGLDRVKGKFAVDKCDRIMRLCELQRSTISTPGEIYTPVSAKLRLLALVNSFGHKVLR